MWKTEGGTAAYIKEKKSQQNKPDKRMDQKKVDGEEGRGARSGALGP